MDATPTGGKPSTDRSLPVVLRRLRRDRLGATAVEYGLVVALVVLAMIGALAGVGDATSSMWNNVSGKVVNAH
jgi:pilus assembly protein Flp/PilA